MSVDLGELEYVVSALHNSNRPTYAELVRKAIAELSALRAAQVGADVRAENERLRGALETAVAFLEVDDEASEPGTDLYTFLIAEARPMLGPELGPGRYGITHNGTTSAV